MPKLSWGMDDTNKRRLLDMHDQSWFKNSKRLYIFAIFKQ